MIRQISNILQLKKIAEALDVDVDQIMHADLVSTYQWTINCVAMHISTFLRQSNENRMADFVEPCVMCELRSDCHANWLKAIYPIIEHATIKDAIPIKNVR